MSSEQSFAVQRRFATPVPAAADLDALSRHLLSCCLKERDRTVSGRVETIGQMFQTERRHAVELPIRPFDPCLRHIRQADKYQTVLFEDVRYSVPRRVAFEPVTIKAYLDRVVLVHKGQVVARHARSRTSGAQVLDAGHFMAVLSRKPAYLDQTRLFKELNLPPVFQTLRDRFIEQSGERTGTRHYIRVLQLLATHPAGTIAGVIEQCLHRQILRAELIEQKLQGGPDTTFAFPSDATPPAPYAGVTVALPDLKRFDQLLSSSFFKGDFDVRPECHAASNESKNPALADDAVGIRQALA